MELPNDVVERFARNEPQPRSKGRKNHPWPDHVPNRTQGENPRAINLTRQSLEKSGLVEDHHVTPSYLEPTNKETNMNNETNAIPTAPPPTNDHTLYFDQAAARAQDENSPMISELVARHAASVARTDAVQLNMAKLDAIQAGQSTVRPSAESQTTWYNPTTWSTGAQIAGGIAAGALIGVALYKIFED